MIEERVPQSPVHTKVFVIGAFDSRITFYSRQVRALSLVHALRPGARSAARLPSRPVELSDPTPKLTHWRKIIFDGIASGEDLAPDSNV